MKELIAKSCQHLNISQRVLLSRWRNADLVKARYYIASIGVLDYNLPVKYVAAELGLKRVTARYGINKVKEQLKGPTIMLEYQNLKSFVNR